MEDKRMKFGNSKAIKITGDMRNDLNSYNSRINEIARVQKEKYDLEKSRTEKKEELEQLNTQANTEDKKAAKDASKKIKTIEKEIEKIDADIKHLEEQIQKAENQHKTPELKGVTLDSFMNFDVKEDIVSDATKEIKSIESAIAEPIVPETPVQAPETTIQEESQENNDTSLISEIESAENDFASELNSVPEEAPIETPEPEITEPIIEDNNEVVNIENPKEKSITEESALELPETEETTESTFDYNFVSQAQLDKMWEELQNTVSEETKEEKKENEESEETSIQTPIIDSKVTPETSESEIQIEEKTSEEPVEFDENKFFEQINVKPEMPKPVNVTKIEDNPDNLTKFSDYNDYVFAFGQKHYGKEALTPLEIDDLDKVQDFLTEEQFDYKRLNQYNDIVSENSDLKEKITTLDNDYRNNIEKMSSEYSDNIAELKKLLDEAKEETETIKISKTQTEKLNTNLTETIKEQDQTIVDLTAQNKGLQDTIVNQSGKVASLEKLTEEQSERIKELEEKINSVLNIFKEADK